MNVKIDMSNKVLKVFGPFTVKELLTFVSRVNVEGDDLKSYRVVQVNEKSDSIYDYYTYSNNVKYD